MKAATSLYQKREPGWVCRANNNFKHGEQRGNSAAVSALHRSVEGGRGGGVGFSFYETGEGRKIR